MPLKKCRGKKVISQNISEFHKGKTFSKTKSKFGKARADKQAAAVAMRSSGMRSPMKMRSEKGMEAYAKKRMKK